MQVLMHSKPMKRHTSHVQPARAELTARIKGDHPNEGLHVRLFTQDGAEQLVIFPLDSLDVLIQSARVARAQREYEGGRLETLAAKLADAECSPHESNWEYLGETERNFWRSVARVALAECAGII